MNDEDKELRAYITFIAVMSLLVCAYIAVGSLDAVPVLG